MYKLGNKSYSKLEGVHPDMIKVVERAIQLSQQDFTVIEGVRTPERQAELYAQGRTKPGNKVTWTMHFPISWREFRGLSRLLNPMTQ